MPRTYMNKFKSHASVECAQFDTDLDFMWRQGHLKEGFLVWQLLRCHSVIPDLVKHERNCSTCTVVLGRTRVTICDTKNFSFSREELPMYVHNMTGVRRQLTRHWHCQWQWTSRTSRTTMMPLLSASLRALS